MWYELFMDRLCRAKDRCMWQCTAEAPWDLLLCYREGYVEVIKVGLRWDRTKLEMTSEDYNSYFKGPLPVVYHIRNLSVRSHYSLRTLNVFIEKAVHITKAALWVQLIESFRQYSHLKSEAALLMLVGHWSLHLCHMCIRGIEMG